MEHDEHPFCVKRRGVKFRRRGSANQGFVIVRGARRELSRYRKEGGNGLLCGNELQG
jgi:hypothetical protein